MVEEPRGEIINGYELSPEALTDLQEIWFYIARDNPAAAD